MKKKTTLLTHLSNNFSLKKLVLKLKISCILSLFTILQLGAGNLYISNGIELNFENTELKHIFDEIKSQSGYNFFYNVNEIDDTQKISLRVKDETITQVLDKLSEKAQLEYTINDKQIVLNVTSKERSSIIQDREINGQIKDDTGTPLPGVNVIVKGTSIGTLTDIDGNFTITVPSENSILVLSYVGFETLEVNVSELDRVDVQMKVSASSLDSVVLVGSRNPSRTAINSTVPIDVLAVSDIAEVAPQITVNEILNYVAPSFTSQTQTVSDGTDHIDPASLRGLGPDQVLVLINGKRRHNTALINVNGTVGAGSVGTDLNAIPVASIERIEVLRDGAAAQYGSDAIAGVINIVLKKQTGVLDLTVSTGANFSKNSNQFEGGADGEKFRINANYGLPLGEKGGYINFTGTLSTREPALRNRDYQGAIFNAFHGAERIFAANGGVVANMTLADYQNAASGLTYLDQSIRDEIAGLDVNNSDDVDILRSLLGVNADEDELAARGLTRKDFRFRVGTSKLREGKFFYNLSIPLADETEFYSFGGLSYRNGLASGFYRRPAQGDGRANTPAFPNGFLPNIGSDIIDRSAAVGIKGVLDNDWNIDFSNTYGQNTFEFTVGNSSNGTLGTATPRSFDAGKLGFSQNTVNLDVSKFHEDILNGFNVALGAEYKVENYFIEEGELLSYASFDVNGDIVTSSTPDDLLVRNNFTGAALGGGAQVFRGFDPNNATNEFRNSLAVYADFEADFSEKFLLSIAGRYENFSDFGGTINGKIAGRYKFSESFVTRGAISTGFRAPSLHQQFFSRTSTVFIDNQPFEQGTFTNDSRLGDLLNIPTLKEETSYNLSLGFTGKIPNLNLSYSIDGYLINIDDRIVYSGSFGPGDNEEIQGIFAAAGATSARFFVNAIDTRTTGLDIVISHKANLNENLRLNTDFAMNLNETEVNSINLPQAILDAGQETNFFDAQEEAFLTLAQPRTKASLSHNLSGDKWNILFRNTWFGEVQDPDAFAGEISAENFTPDSEAIYSGRLITDLTASYKVLENLNLTVGANNLFDVYPSANRTGGTAGDQFVFSRRTSQFGYTGRLLFARINFKL